MTPESLTEAVVAGIVTLVAIGVWAALLWVVTL